jgi:hypothetical protein
MKKILGNEKGAVAIIIAVGLVALMLAVAMTIDVGSLFEERRLLQTVADSAALAGAQELPENPDEAIQKAIDYANNNYGENVDSIDVEISSTLATNDTITVTILNPDAPLYFARVTGKDSTPVGASAKAIIASPEVVSDIVPWGIPQEDISTTGDSVLKWGSGPDGHSYSGNFQALGIDKPGGNEYRENIEEGAETDLKCRTYDASGNMFPGDMVDTETGNLVGPTIQGAESRIYDYPNNLLDGFDDLVGSYAGGNCLLVPDSQFIIVPVIESLVDAEGHSEVEILNFACFIITGIEDMHGDAEFGNGVAIVGRFLDMALVNTNGSIIAVGSNSLRVIRLIK